MHNKQIPDQSVKLWVIKTWILYVITKKKIAIEDVQLALS